MNPDTSTTLSSQLISRSKRHVWHPCTQMQHHEKLPLVALSHGSGPWLFDQDGNRYLDGISSWWTNLFGHANPRINAALKEQLEKLSHAMLAGFTHEPVVQLSERLSELTQNALQHCFYASDGASSVEIALKMSFHAWKNAGFPDKREFVALEGSYHGETLGALSVTDVALYKDIYAPLLRSVHTVASPDARLAEDGQTAEDVARQAALKLQALFEERAQNIAALIIEPLIQCATGFAMHDPLYLKEVSALCRRFNVHLIADEIAVGFGRTGTFFACEQARIWPDFLTLSKGLSAGYLPLSVVMTTSAIYDLFYHEDLTRGFLHSHTFTGNPLACQAALASLDIFRDDDIISKNRKNAQLLNTKLAELAAHEKIENFRQCGMVWAFEVPAAHFPPFMEASPTSFAGRFFAAALKNGLLLRPIDNTIYLMPPYILNESEMDFLAGGTLATLDTVLKK